MRVTIGMIVLNEEEFIEKNLRQHYWAADSIIIVEGADRLYPRATADGLSTDRTAEIIRDFPDPDRKIRFIQHGWANRTGDQAKCELRNRYAHWAEDGLLIALDADEFYGRADLDYILNRARNGAHEHAWCYPFMHLWKDYDHFITGGYYDVPHIRFWRWQQGAKYERNHNHPEIGGRFLQEFGLARFEREVITIEESGLYYGAVRSLPLGHAVQHPLCYHFGFVRSGQSIAEKNAYYVARGEAQTRPQTTESRAAWFTTDLPPGHTIYRNAQSLPEVFQEGNP